MTKKQREQRYIEQFAACFPDFPAGEIESREEPDFLIHGLRGPLGIEVRQLFKPATDPHPPQAQEALEQHTVSKAQQIFEATHPTPLVVSFHFSAQEPLRKSRIEPLASEIAILVSINMPETEEQKRLENPWDECTPFPEEIEVINVLRPANITKPLWYPVRAGWEMSACSDYFQEVIDEKNARHAAYKQCCGELWLLLVAPNSAPSSFIDLSPEVLSHRFTSSFDRIFFFNPFVRTFSELPIARADHPVSESTPRTV